MKRALVVAIAVLSLVASGRPLLAGVADSPLPVLPGGGKTYHVYSVPGVMNGPSATTVTFFECTSLEKTATIQIGVEVFEWTGSAANDPLATSVGMVPGETVLFSTGPLIIGSSFDPDVYLSLFNIGRRTARILATSKKIMCTAFVADPFNQPPTVMSYLPMIAKTKQKAAN